MALLQLSVRRTLSVAFATWAIASCSAAGQGVHEDRVLPEPNAKQPVYTQHNNGARTGAMLHETCLTPETVSSGSFGKLGSWSIDGQIYAQPLFVPDLQMESGGKRNALIIATMTNQIYALDADRPGVVLWGPIKLGTPVDHNFFCMAFWWLPGNYNIWPYIGVTSTPVIDPNTLDLYVEAKIQLKAGHCPFSRAQVEQRLFKIDVRTGNILREKTIDGSIKARGLGVGSEDGYVSFDPVHHLQRAALLLANDRIYVAFGGHQDTDPYHGWVMAFDKDTLELQAQLCTTCGAPGSKEGGVWQAGDGLAANCPDPEKRCAGDVFLMSGNGDFDPTFGDFGSSFLRLDTNLKVVDWFTPANYECLNRLDVDLGSSGPLVLPSGRVLGAGKEGVMFSLDQRLGGLQEWSDRPGKKPCWDRLAPGRRPALQTFQVSPLWRPDAPLIPIAGELEPLKVFGFRHVHGGAVYWKNRAGRAAYVWPEMERLRGFRQNEQGLFTEVQPPGKDPSSSLIGTIVPPHGMPGGMLSLSARGDDPMTGVIWASIPIHGNALSCIVPGVLYAIRAWPQDGGVDLPVLWSSEDRAEDRVGSFSKNSPPTVVDGHVYLPTFSGQLQVYGLHDPSLCERRSTIQPHAVSQKVRMPPPPPEHGEFVRVDGMPGKIEVANTPIQISVTMKNTGTIPWVRGQVWLDASGDSGWGQERVELSRTLEPNRSVTFSVPVKREREGRYQFVWSMVARGAPFGTASDKQTMFVHERRCDEVRTQREKIAGELRNHRDAMIQEQPRATVRLFSAVRVQTITRLNRDARQLEDEAAALGCENESSERRRRAEPSQ